MTVRLVPLTNVGCCGCKSKFAFGDVNYRQKAVSPRKIVFSAGIRLCFKQEKFSVFGRAVSLLSVS